MLVAALAWYSGQTGGGKDMPQEGNHLGVLVYSPTCPHCHSLMKYLDEKYPDAPILRTTDGSKIKEYLKEAGVSWDGGVPIMAVRVDGNVFVLSGFPSENQDVNGYFMGREKELSLCKGMRGTPYPNEQNYLFCILPDGKILGNKYVVDWVLSKIG
ncbi:MAG: hypothetical protein PWP76_121 [Candidatus Diapherotrites archaeon]|nr:hypothetical protein [Candidatus Diapherotrites archaeon]MDN5366981.1 hypothetical protein [Candidatus Diapherotrites archaeon]